MGDTFGQMSNTPNIVYELDPKLARKVWEQQYRSYVILNGDIHDDYALHTPVDFKDREMRSGACMQNALRTMDALVASGIPEEHLRAVYVINYSQRNHYELCMTNSLLRTEEQMDDADAEEADNRMSYHLTVVYNPNANGWTKPRDLLDATVCDLTASDELLGEEFPDFCEAIFFDDELLRLNTRVMGFVLTHDTLRILNDRLMSGKASEFSELKDYAETFYKLQDII